jgi:uncharacterized protein YutD
MHQNFVLSFEYCQIKDDETVERVVPVWSVRDLRNKYSEILEKRDYLEDVGSTRGPY